MAGWTTPRTWVTSEVDTAAIFNAHLRDNENAEIAVCRAVVAWTGPAVLPFSAGATTAFTFTSVAADPLGMWSIGSPTRVTVPIAGRYLFSGRISGAAGASTFTAKLNKNGALVATGTSATGGFGFSMVGDGYDVQLAASDYLELAITVASGGPPWFGLPMPNITFLDGTSIIADLSIQWVAP